MLNSKNKIIRGLLAFCVVLGLIFAVTYQDFFDDLRPSNITEEIPFHPEWEITPLTQIQNARLNNILKQNFTFIGEGGQSYVFESDDHRYVLKLFKFKRFRPSWYVKWLPEDWKKSHVEKREQKLFTAFNGHKLAYDQLRDESGLVFIQLNPSHSPRNVLITDRFGSARQVDLGQASFVVQEKGETLEENFSRLMKQGRPDLVRENINRVLELYLSEYRKGIYDLDHGVMHNIGFVGDKPLHMDVGKLVQDEKMKSPENYQADLDKVSGKMELWVKNHGGK